MRHFMAKTMLFLFVLFAFVLTGCEKEDGLDIIPLENLNGDFRSYLIETFDVNKDGVLSQDEADAVTEMDCPGYSGLYSLDGIQYFKNLKVLRFSNGNSAVKSLDLSENTKLEELYIGFSDVTSLDLSKNVSLRILDCQRNKLSSLILPESTSLETLYCQENQELSSLNLTKYTALKDLKCGDCNFSKLDLSACKDLKTLFCDIDIEDVTFAEGVKLDELSVGGKALDVRNLNVAKLYCPNAISLIASNNLNLKEIVPGSSLNSIIADGSGLESFSYNSYLTVLYLKDCKKLKSFNINVSDKYGKRPEAYIDVDLSGCTALETIEATSIISLNANGCTALKYVDCFGMIERATFEGCSALENLIFSSWAELASLDVSDCKALKNLRCYGKFTNLDLSENTSLDSLICMAPITDIDINSFTKLRYLELNTYSLSSIDASNNNTIEDMFLRQYYDGGVSTMCDINVSSSKSLKKIVVGFGYMTFCNVKSLNAENCTSLESIVLNGAYALESLNIKDCSSLKNFSINDSYSLSSLDFSDVVSLDSIYIENVDMQSVKMNEDIRIFEIRNNRYLTSLDISNCRKLEKLIATSNALSSIELNQCASLKHLECYNNNIASLDVSPCTDLVFLSCSDNKITSLDVSPCTKLASLGCQNNKLKGTLDVSMCKALTELYCKDNADLEKLIINKGHIITSLNKDAHTVLELKD
jgi:hypothetical protein